MVLGFSYEWPSEMQSLYGLRSGFPEAVLSSQYGSADEIPEQYRLPADDDRIAYWKVGNVRPKIHTFRKPSGRKKAGSKLHPTIDARTKDTFQFCPELELISKQALTIRHTFDTRSRKVALVRIDGEPFGWAHWSGRLMTYATPALRELAANDGFRDLNAFFAWFSEDGDYDILHWTDKEYEGKCKDFPDVVG